MASRNVCVWVCYLSWNTEEAAFLLASTVSFTFHVLMSTILLLPPQPGVTDISQVWSDCTAQKTIFNINISPHLLGFNCTGSLRDSFASAANIALSHLISREGVLLLVSDVHLFFNREMSFNVQELILLAGLLMPQHINDDCF